MSNTNKKTSNEPFNQPAFLSPQQLSATGGGGRPLGNTSNPNRQSNTQRVGTSSHHLHQNGRDENSGKYDTNKKGYTSSHHHHQRQRSPPNANSNNTMMNQRSSSYSSTSKNSVFQKQEPGCFDRFSALLVTIEYLLKSVWRKLMTIPYFFVIFNYFLPFCFEVAILAIHFDELDRLPSDTPFFSWDWFPRLRTYVVAESILGTLLLVKFIFNLLFLKQEGVTILRALFTFNGIVSLVVLPMMMYPGFVNNAAAFQGGVVSPTSENVWKASVGKISTSTLDMIRSGELMFSIPSVACWRIWLVYDIIQTLIFASSTVSKSFRAIVYQLSFIFTLFFNCMSTMQLIFCIEQGRLVSLATSFYFTVVTLSTVGFGEISPTSALGRAFIITQIFAALIAVPLLLAETDRLLKFLLSLTGYAGSDRHVIIFGELTQAELDQLLCERTVGDGANDPLHMVFVAPKFTPEFQEKIASCPANDMITLCVATQLSRTEVLRFAPNRADAALFYSNTQAAAMRGDYRTIAAAASLRLHHPSLPQYLMMRRTDTAHLVEGAFVVYDRDFLRAALLGTSLQIPGFLPMFLNLIRYVPDKEVGVDPIMKEYKRRKKEFERIQKRREEQEEEEGGEHDGTRTSSRGNLNNNNDDGGETDDYFNNNNNNGDRNQNTKKSRRYRPKTVKEQAAEDFQRQQDEREARMNNYNNSNNGKGAAKKKKSFWDQFQERRRPDEARPKTKEEEEREEAKNINNQSWYNMYMKGAKQNIYTITVPDVLVGRTFVVASFIVQLRTGALPIGLVRDSRVCLNAGNTPITDSDSLVVIATSWNDLYSSFSNFPATSSHADHTSVAKIALRSKEVHFETEHHATATALWLANCHNYFPFQNHVVLVDLASFVSQPELCPEESYQREQFQVRDMIALATRFPKWQSFVLLSLNPVSELLQQEWAASGRQPIFHIQKSPLDPESLKLCKIGKCMSILIFSSLHVANANDDNFRSAMLTVNRQVMTSVQVEMANNPDWSHPNVITVIGNPEEALLLSPEHVTFGSETIDHDAHCCAFATGGALSPTLLDGLMFRTYYNEYLPQIVELMLEPEAILRENAKALAPALFDDDLDEAAKEAERHHRERRERKRNRRRAAMAERAAAAVGATASDGGRSSRVRFEEPGGGGGNLYHGDDDDDLDDDDALVDEQKKSMNLRASNTSSLYHNFGDRRLPTFGQLCRVLTAGKIVCFGFSRVIQTPERGVDTLGKVFFYTNPDLTTLIMPDDYIFYLPAWSSERLSKDFFS